MEAYKGSNGLEFSFLTISTLLKTSRDSPTSFPNKANRILKTKVAHRIDGQ